MKSKYLTLIILGTLLLIAVIFVFNMKHKNLPVEITQIDVTPYTNEASIDKNKYLVPDGEYIGSVGSVLRIDDIYVDDQYFAFTEISSLNEGNLIELELLNDVKIFLLQNSANATKHLEPITLEVFRKIMRAEAKSSSGFSRVFKLKVKDNLIVEITEVKSQENDVSKE